MIRKTSFIAALFGAAFLLCLPPAWAAGADYADVKAQIAKQHDDGVKRLQDWIKLPSIAAEDLNYPQGADYMIKLLKDAGFQRAERVETEGKPGVFATLDAGAPKTIGLYFMYDVKQFPDLKAFWQESKENEVKTIERLKELIREHVRKNNF